MLLVHALIAVRTAATIVDDERRVQHNIDTRRLRASPPSSRHVFCDMIMSRFANTWLAFDRIWHGGSVSSQCLLLEPTSASSRPRRDRASVVLCTQWSGFGAHFHPIRCVWPRCLGKPAAPYHTTQAQPTQTTSTAPSPCSRVRLPKQALTYHPCISKPLHGLPRSPACALPLQPKTAGRFLHASSPTTSSLHSTAVHILIIHVFFTHSQNHHLLINRRGAAATGAHRAGPLQLCRDACY